jgi:hypothetical protein
MVGDQVIRRIYDQSDRSMEFHVSKALLDDQGDYWNGAPTNKRWRKISKAEVDRICEEC